MYSTFSRLSKRYAALSCFMLLLSISTALAQTTPTSITVSGGCLTGAYVLTSGAAINGKPTYVGTVSASFQSGNVTNAPFGLQFNSQFNWTAFINLSGGATTDPFDGDDGQPYLHTTSATALPPTTGWTYGPMLLCENYSTFAVQYPSSGPSTPASLTVSAVLGSASVCAGGSVTLTASATGGNSPYSYSWTAPANATLVGSATANPVIARIAAGASGTLSFSVTATDAGVTPTAIQPASQARIATRSASTASGSATVSVSVNQVPSVTITPSVTTIIIGQTVTLTAAGADSYTWNTGSNQSSISDAPTQQTSYTVSGSHNGCTGQATATVSATCAEASAQAISTTVVGELGPGNCSVKISGNGFGTSLVLTGPDKFVYSRVFRRAGTYDSSVNVTQPGTYTFTVQNRNACGDIYTDTRTFVVTGTACP